MAIITIESDRGLLNISAHARAVSFFVKYISGSLQDLPIFNPGGIDFTEVWVEKIE